MIENFFTEEKRIQRIVNDAVSEKENKIEELRIQNKEYQEKSLKNLVNYLIHHSKTNLSEQEAIEKAKEILALN